MQQDVFVEHQLKIILYYNYHWSKNIFLEKYFDDLSK